MLRKILVGTDGSKSASAAVKHAAGLAEASGAELLVVSVYASPAGDTGGPLATAPYPTASVASSIVADAVGRLVGGAKARGVVHEGSAADGIIDVAESEKVDLIVVGNKGMTGTKRFLLGSVPGAVSHHAPCSVLIVQTT